MQPKLQIQNLHVMVEGKPILRGVDFDLPGGEIHVLMGPNGSGKSTLAQTLMGQAHFEVTAGQIFLNDVDITSQNPEERARLGLFLAFQNPLAVPGVKLFNFLWLAYKSVKKSSISAVEFLKILEQKAEILKLDPSFIHRNVNEGFSGGEKKKAEMLQLLTLEPNFALLDEIDSGLDVDALKIVAESIQILAQGPSHTGFILITHYHKLLDYLQPDHVYVMKGGKIVAEGGEELIQKIEETGYSTFSN